MTVNINLDQRASQQICGLLSLFLSDLYVLKIKTQNFHWNIEDPRFYSLHLFLEKQYEQLEENIDEVAERIRMLGEKSPGSMHEFLSKTSLKEARASDLSGDEMLQDLLYDHEKVIKQLREGIEKCSDLGDEGTADLFIQSLRYHEKTAWMIRSHLTYVKI